jgi:hypothetical protein
MKIILIILITFLIIFFVSDTKNLPQMTDNKCLVINRELFDKFVKIITDYSAKGKDHNDKILHIYMASFSILNLNFPQETLDCLDKGLEGVKCYELFQHFPEWSAYPNIQIVIVNTINRMFNNSERVITNDVINNLSVVHPYMVRLFDELKIVVS